MALIENIQRENLNPIDERCYRRLADDFQQKQEDIAAAVGEGRASVANYLLLKLPTVSGSRRAAVDGPCPRASRPASEADILRVARDVSRGPPVRETESMVKKSSRARPRAAAKPAQATRAAEDRSGCCSTRACASFEGPGADWDRLRSEAGNRIYEQSRKEAGRATRARSWVCPLR
jgi:ParB-like chromosome segregation protein Spo0J